MNGTDYLLADNKILQEKLDIAVETLEKVKRSLEISFLGKPFVMKKSCKELLIIKEALLKIKGEK